MQLKKQILTGVGALAFMALLALNVQLVQNPNEEMGKSIDLTLLELAASAQSVGEDYCTSILYCEGINKNTKWIQGASYCCQLNSYKTGKRQI